MEKKLLKPVVNQIARTFTKNNISYSQSQYIFKEVRKQLELKPPKRNKGTVKRLSRKEFQDFINAAYDKSPMVGLMMQTLFETAARVNEFTSFNADDIYFEELRMIVQEGKGSKRREIPIEEGLARLLATHLYKRQSGPLFRSQRGNRFSDRRIQQIVEAIAKDAGIQSIKVTPHTFRHTRLTFLSEDGMGKDYIQHFAGHERTETTEIYTRTAALDLDREFRRVSYKAR